MLPEVKFEKSAMHIQLFAIKCCKFLFILHDLVLHFRFKLFKICEIRSFSYVAGSQNYEKIQHYTLKHLQSNSISTSVTLTYFFKVKNGNCFFLGNRRR